MNEPNPCKRLCDCIQFADFVPSTTTDKLYVNSAQSITVTCPDGTQTNVSIPAGIIGYVLTFDIGQGPYPDLILNCTGGMLVVPVPSDVTQAQLDALVNGMINTCLAQLAVNIGCAPPGVYYNTMQTISCPSNNVQVPGALPAGVSANASNLSMAAGVVESTISVDDANAKSLQVLYDMFQTGNANCSGGPLPIS
jgi:hypothetical protein